MPTPSAKQSRKQLAAWQKIWLCYQILRNQLSPKNQLVRTADLSLLEQLMLHVRHCIPHSSTANFVNRRQDTKLNERIWRNRLLSGKTLKGHRTLDLKDRHRQKVIERSINAAIDDQAGNCLEMASFLVCLILFHPHIQASFKKATRMASLQTPDDHAMVIVGDLDDPKALILDPWIGLIEKSSAPVQKCSHSDQKLGFLGSQSQYQAFLKSHEGSSYIVRGEEHLLETDKLQPSPKTIISVMLRLRHPLHKLDTGCRFRGPVNAQGKPDGTGELLQVNSSRITGTWQNGRLVGPAEKVSCLSGNYEHYQGQLDDDYCYHGLGTCTVEVNRYEQESYRAQWKHGKMKRTLPELPSKL